MLLLLRPCGALPDWRQRKGADMKKQCRRHPRLRPQALARVLYCRKASLLFLVIGLIASVALLVASLVSFLVFVFLKVVLFVVVPLMRLVILAFA